MKLRKQENVEDENFKDNDKERLKSERIREQEKLVITKKLYSNNK